MRLSVIALGLVFFCCTACAAQNSHALGAVPRSSLLMDEHALVITTGKAEAGDIRAMLDLHLHYGEIGDDARSLAWLISAADAGDRHSRVLVLAALAKDTSTNGKAFVMYLRHKWKENES